ncbi:hypothetical protein CN478_26980 [Bacillus cereus]|nr:hypothetical protein CON04_16935 [Bacillus cereus]PEC24374.1 hypothetical protein CON75_29560 [Bacillus thuringiensis]PEQ72038.1 hypothetical protein CN478_26980 [Bacillus cereus]PFT33332.1 hypothetical protein COK71_14520 [Bacillus cereus]PFZ18413.1 hypothetical protein COL73_19525 [Bacillus thuringiensis]
MENGEEFTKGRLSRSTENKTFPPIWNVMGNPQLPRHAINFNDGNCEFWIWYEKGPDSENFREYVYMTCP